MSDLSIGGDVIRRFNDSGIQAQIDAAVAGLGDKHLAVTAVNSDDGQRFAAVVKIDNAWSVIGVLEHRPSGWSHEEAVRWSPF